MAVTHPAEAAAQIVVSVVAFIAAGLALLAMRAVKRSGNRRLGLVAAAFGLLAAKGLLVAWSLGSHAIGHEYLELVSALFDLGVVALLALPLLK